MAGTGPVAATADGRHPGVVAAARWLDVNPGLPAELQVVARVFARAAMDLLDAVPFDGPELTSALNGLTQAKDHAVRAAIAGQGVRLQQ
jgi:hypothetical protein